MAWFVLPKRFYVLCFWLLWVSVAACGLSLRRAGAALWLQSAAFSLPWLLSLWSPGSRVLRLGSRGELVSLLHSMYRLPRPGIEPVFLACQSGFLTTDHRGSPGVLKFLINFFPFCLSLLSFFVFVNGWWAHEGGSRDHLLDRAGRSMSLQEVTFSYSLSQIRGSCLLL